MPYRIIHHTCTIVTKADNITPIQSDGAQQTLPPRPFTSSSPGQDATNSSQQEHYPTHAHATVLTLVHAFVSIRLDYCNSVLYSVSGRLLRKLQTVQNAAARVVTRPRKFDHITPVWTSGSRDSLQCSLCSRRDRQTDTQITNMLIMGRTDAQYMYT